MMRKMIVLALVAFACIKAAPQTEEEKIKYINDVKVDYSALSSGTIDESNVQDAIAQLKSAFTKGKSASFVKLSDRAEDILDRHARAIEDIEAIPDQKQRVMKKLEQRVAEMKANGKLPESFQIPENFVLPELFKGAKHQVFEMPEKLREKLNL